MVYDKADADAATILLGGTVFLTTTFYLLNHSDDNIRCYSWNIVSFTIATFVGVLLCMTFNSAISECVSLTVGESHLPMVDQDLIINALCAALWITLLQCVLARVTGAATGYEKLEFENTRRESKTWSTFVGMMVSFSILRFWGTVQHMMTLSVVARLALALVVLFLMRIFLQFIENQRRTTIADDGQPEDEFDRVFLQDTATVEDNTMGLVLAHLIMQSVRLYITGSPPLPMGVDPAGLVIEYHHCRVLAGFCCLFIFLSPMTNCLPHKVPFETSPRLRHWLKKACGNCVAFGTLYNVHWVMRLLKLSGPNGEMAAALGVTLATYVLVFVLDAIADAECSPPAVDTEVRFYVEPLSLLIGLSWKQCFVVSITAFTQKIGVLPVSVETLFMAVGVSIIIVPAWRMYIVPVIMHPEWHQKWQDMVEAPRDGKYEQAGSLCVSGASELVRRGKSGLTVPSDARVIVLV